MKQFLLFLSFSIFSFAVFSQPIITQNPQSTTVCIDTCKTLNITAVGNNLIYNWQMLDSSVWQTFLSSNQPEYNFCADSLYDTIWVRCVVEEGGLFDTSNVVYIATDSCLPPQASFSFEINSDTVCFTNTSLRATTILWNFGDGSQSSDQQPCNMYAAIENYTVKLYAYNDFGSDLAEMDVNLIGIEEIDLFTKVFPNPSSGKVYLTSENVLESASLIDLQGNVVYQQRIEKAQTELDFSAISKGVYFLKVDSQKGATFQKIVLR